MNKIAILGGGSWGTALAITLAKSARQHSVALWLRNETNATELRKVHENKNYLPGIAIPADVEISSDMAAVLRGATTIIGAMPAAHARGIYTSALPYLANNVQGTEDSPFTGPQTVLVSATKGLEPETHMRMSEVIAEVVASQFLPQIAVLSGPSFAAEVACGAPTALVVASRAQHSRFSGTAETADDLARTLQEELTGQNFRLYTNEDVIGVELAGAMKNVIAIAAGVCQGLNLGANALAALITRGLAEMTRVVVALGGKAETLSGLAGLGDLVLTCNGTLSRNRHVGVELAKGRELAEILGEMRMVAEGVGTTTALLAIAREHQLELPITEQVGAILQQQRSPREAIREIMERPLKRE